MGTICCRKDCYEIKYFQGKDVARVAGRSFSKAPSLESPLGSHALWGHNAMGGRPTA